MNRTLRSKREILISVTPYEKRVAILDDNHLAEVFYEQPEGHVQVGNIYKGVVNAVLPGLQAAFVDLGVGKAGFLHVDDAIDRTKSLSSQYSDEDEASGKSGPTETIDQLLKVGQELLVQVTKEPMGTKGPRLTTHLTLPGRFLVCLPGTDFVGVSKKSRDNFKRRELRRLVQKLKGPDVGYIVRTLGLRESEDEFRKQMEILESKWRSVQQNKQRVKAPGLLYRESDLSESTMRDYFSQNVDKVVVDNQEEHRNIVDYLRVLSPDLVEKVELFGGATTLFDYYGLDEELEKIFETRVNLRRGGYLIIEQTEALVSIDVNTGGKVRGHDQGKNIVETNIDAAWEIAKQMRLRDLGGLIIIDFIDMESPEDRERVESEFKKAIRQDKAPIHFALISQFGLMELTRKRVRANLVKNTRDICPTCNGNRYIPRPQAILADIDRWVRRCRVKSSYRHLQLALSSELTEKVLENRGLIVKFWERRYGLKIELLEDESAPLISYRFFDPKTNSEITHLFTTTYGEEAPAETEED